MHIPTQKSRVIFVCSAGQSDTTPQRGLTTLLKFSFPEAVSGNEPDIVYVRNTYEAGVAILNAHKSSEVVAAVVQAENTEIAPDLIPDTPDADEEALYNELTKSFNLAVSARQGKRALNFLQKGVLSAHPETKLILFTNDGKKKIPPSLDGVMYPSGKHYGLTTCAREAVPG